MTGEKPASEELSAVAEPQATFRGAHRRPPKVIWRFAPEHQSRHQRLLWLLFEQVPEQEQAEIGSERHPL